MPQHLPDPDLPAPAVDDHDRAAAASPSAASPDPDRTDTEPPRVREAVLAIARLLGRQAGREFMAEGE